MKRNHKQAIQYELDLMHDIEQDELDVEMEMIEGFEEDFEYMYRDKRDDIEEDFIDYDFVEEDYFDDYEYDRGMML